MIRRLVAATIPAALAALAFVPHQATAQEVAMACAATSPATQIVCADPTLAIQHQRVAEHYAYLMANAPFWATEVIGRDQVEWTTNRDACGASVSCLGAAYHGRLVGLYSWYECLRTDLPLDG